MSASVAGVSEASAASTCLGVQDAGLYAKNGATVPLMEISIHVPFNALHYYFI